MGRWPSRQAPLDKTFCCDAGLVTSRIIGQPPNTSSAHTELSMGHKAVVVLGVEVGGWSEGTLRHAWPGSCQGGALTTTRVASHGNQSSVVEKVVVRLVGGCATNRFPCCCPLTRWLSGFLASWHLGLLASWMPGFLASRLLGFPVSWLPGFLAFWVPGCLVFWVLGFFFLVSQ